MSQLTASTIRAYDYDAQPLLNDLPVKAAVAIFKGSAVSHTGGFSRQLVAADVFQGFAEEDVDNTVGAAANGSKTVKVRQRGFIQLTVTNVATAADYGGTVYASDGNTFTTASTGNTAIGKVARWITSTTCIVFFEAAAVRSI